ncbi:MAG: NAD-dependent epimerase/dehydratase family protein, partial [Flavobacteriales bacterium]|nr:NAD-dependent epimerase/dehydratase family protein [Flavobacteriales bacterium]
MVNKMVIAGGSGTIGKHLIDYFKDSFEEIVILSRSNSTIQNDYRVVNWDARTQGEWGQELDGADVIINLTGKSIQTRFTEENKRTLYSSRVDSTQAIGQAIAMCESAPKVWINASGAAIYPSTID